MINQKHHQAPHIEEKAVFSTTYSGLFAAFLRLFLLFYWLIRGEFENILSSSVYNNIVNGAFIYTFNLTIIYSIVILKVRNYKYGGGVVTEFTLEMFGNDKYVILKLLSENQVKVKDDFYVPLSQQEIADIAHFSKLKTNRLLNELLDADMIIYFNGKRGKYAITNKGHRVLQLMQKNNY